MTYQQLIEKLHANMGCTKQHTTTIFEDFTLQDNEGSIIASSEDFPRSLVIIRHTWQRKGRQAAIIPVTTATLTQALNNPTSPAAFHAVLRALRSVIWDVDKAHG